jgi:hypothetical protein
MVVMDRECMVGHTSTIPLMGILKAVMEVLPVTRSESSQARYDSPTRVVDDILDNLHQHVAS